MISFVDKILFLIIFNDKSLVNHLTIFITYKLNKKILKNFSFLYL